MSATLKLTHKAIGAEVRRGAYDVEIDGERVGSVDMNGTIEMPVAPGRHTLRTTSGRNSSSAELFDAVEGETVAFRCTGKLADLSRILRPAQAGTETRSGVSRRQFVAPSSTSSSPLVSPDSDLTPTVGTTGQAQGSDPSRRALR